MPIQYTGVGDFYEVKIGLIGDGLSNSVVIDLTKAPFALDFKGGFPTAVSVAASGSLEKSAVTLLSNAKIQIDYLDIVPQEPTPPQDRLTIRLLYGGTS